MSYVEINCRYQELLDRHGLRTCRDFLALSGVIICGHPDRHVASVLLGSGDGALILASLVDAARDRLAAPA